MENKSELVELKRQLSQEMTQDEYFRIVRKARKKGILKCKTSIRATMFPSREALVELIDESLKAELKQQLSEAKTQDEYFRIARKAAEEGILCPNGIRFSMFPTRKELTESINASL